MTSKRKTKQLRWLVTGLMLAMTMVMPTSTWAQVMYTVYDNGKLTFKYGVKPGSGTVYDVPTDPKTSPGWLAKHKNSIETVVFDESFRYALPTSCYKWFESCSNLTSIENIENLNLNTVNVKDMSFMFWGCEKLTSLDVSKFITAKVTDMSYMFYNCSGLTSLNLLSFRTAMVENMSGMFRGCSSLESLNLSRFNTANVTNMGFMFYDCKKLTSLTLSSFFNTAKVTDMSWMFNGCSGLTSLNLSNFNTANVTSMSSMFRGCSSLTSLDLSKFNTAKVTTMGSMFKDCQKLTSLDLSSFNTAKVTYMSYMFQDCSGLTSLNLSNFDTSNVTDMSQMFDGCLGLSSLDLSSFNTANVTGMASMFSGCSSLTSLDLSNFDTSNVTSMYHMFDGCSGLTSLDLSSFNTAEVTYMTNMFYDCSGLTKIYVSDDFNTDKVSDSYYMFYNCTSLYGAASFDSNKTDKVRANYKNGYFKTYFALGGSKRDLCGETLTTEILNLSEKDFVAHAPFTAKKATYYRDLSTSGSTWFSLCLPFAYTPNNFTAYKLKGATAEAVEIEKITGTIAAGTPVLFKFKDSEEKEIKISATGANIEKAPVDGAKVNGTDGSSLQLCGTYQTKTFSKDADGNAFILLNNKLMNPAKMLNNQNVTKVSVKPFRAYMTLTAPAQTSSARAFSIGHGDEGNEGTTAIDLLNSVVTDDAEYYDINGRRIDAPAKGVNIVRRGNKTIKLIIK